MNYISRRVAFAATILSMSALLLGGCTLFSTGQNISVPRENTTAAPTSQATDDANDAMMEKNGEDVAAEDEDGSMMEKTEGNKMMNGAVSYSGTVLAGSASPVVDFNKKDFDAAVAAGKNIVLYFYASWCPICKAEIPKMYSAFDQLSDLNLVAFRVNFNDNDTDNDEKNLARAHGVPYQHTKVFLKGGTERVLKSPETWDTQRYLSEIAKAFN